MWQPQRYRQLVRASGWYDLIVTVAFVTPWSFLLLHDLLSGLTQTWHVPGSLPSFEPMHMLMANLLGSIVCVWSVLRIRDPQLVFGRYDAAARLLFAAWQAYALWHGATHLLLGFLIMELTWAVLQLWPHAPPHSVNPRSMPRLPGLA